jgi:hypothetical protein
MPAALLFVIYLLALLAFLGGALWPLLRREPYAPVHLVSLGLALVDLVWVVQSAQAAF